MATEKEMDYGPTAEARQTGSAQMELSAADGFCPGSRQRVTDEVRKEINKHDGATCAQCRQRVPVIYLPDIVKGFVFSWHKVPDERTGATA